jgi:hypothetical protein
VRSQYFRAFGLSVESTVPLPGIGTAPSEAPDPRISVVMSTPRELQENWSGAIGPPVWETILGDGIALQHELGWAGDHRFLYGSAAFHVSADAGTVRCSMEHPEDASWQRQLLDTILFSVSFARGFELLHASAVESDRGVVAFIAPSGGGKTTIAAELGRRGYRIFSDDVLAIGRCGEDVMCHPGPAVMSISSSVDLFPSLRATVVARFEEEDELWVAVEGAATSPRALRAVYLLDRQAGRCSVSNLPARTVLDLLPHAISLPHGPARARSRFELFSALAAQIAMFRLTADPTASARTLADLVETSLAAGPTCAGVG